MPILSSEEFRLYEQFNSEGKDTKQGINRNTSVSFNHKYISPTVETSLDKNEYIGFLKKDNQVVASGFGTKEISNGKHDTMYIHTFSVHSNYRNQGLCQKIVNEFIKKFGRKYILYLTVRTEKGDENIGAIKCYEKNDFIMLPNVYRDHYDGKNNAMIRLPTPNKKTKAKKHKTKHKNKKKI